MNKMLLFVVILAVLICVAAETSIPGFAITADVLDTRNFDCKYGQRQYGDYRVEEIDIIWDYAYIKNKTLGLVYEGTSRGCITYIDIYVQTNSNRGNCQMRSGGIGQQSAHVVVSIKDTYYVNIRAYFYAKSNQDNVQG